MDRSRTDPGKLVIDDWHKKSPSHIQKCSQLRPSFLLVKSGQRRLLRIEVLETCRRRIINSNTSQDAKMLSAKFHNCIRRNPKPAQGVASRCSL
jgi:hypothetical protein